MVKTIFAGTSVLLGIAVTPINAQSFPIPGSDPPKVPFGFTPPPTQPIPNANPLSNNVTTHFSNGLAPQPHMTIHGGNERIPSFTGQVYDQYKIQSSPNMQKK